MRDLDIHDKVAYDESFIFARSLLHGRSALFTQNLNILVNFRCLMCPRSEAIFTFKLNAVIIAFKFGFREYLFSLT